jgi:hypothetical protein
MPTKKYTHEDGDDLRDSHDAIPEATGLMNRVRDARDHLTPFLTDRRAEVPEEVRAPLQEASDALNDVYSVFVLHFSVIYMGLDSTALRTTIGTES